jgi:hypothetical protein
MLYCLSFVIIRIMRYMPTGQASSAAKLKKPLARAPSESPNKANAAMRRRGAAQHIAIVSPPLSHPLPCILQLAVSVSVPTAAPDGFSEVSCFSSNRTCLPYTLPFCSRSAPNSSLLVVITASPLLDISFDPFERLFIDLAFRVTFFENLQRILSVAHRERHL